MQSLNREAGPRGRPAMPLETVPAKAQRDRAGRAGRPSRLVPPSSAAAAIAIVLGDATACTAAAIASGVSCGMSDGTTMMPSSSPAICPIARRTAALMPLSSRSSTTVAPRLRAKVAAFLSDVTTATPPSTALLCSSTSSTSSSISRASAARSSPSSTGVNRRFASAKRLTGMTDQILFPSFIGGLPCTCLRTGALGCQRRRQRRGRAVPGPRCRASTYASPKPADRRSRGRLRPPHQ